MKTASHILSAHLSQVENEKIDNASIRTNIVAAMEAYRNQSMVEKPAPVQLLDLPTENFERAYRIAFDLDDDVKVNVLRIRRSIGDEVEITNEGFIRREGYDGVVLNVYSSGDINAYTLTEHNGVYVEEYLIFNTVAVVRYFDSLGVQFKSDNE